ncbi:MAG: transglycosylase domain-containing protein [Ectothiorhodospiraceae bacterium]|nr:transglycosylase domain-containing protein [Ectothiorhodospiraceae bacterium]
MFKKTRSGRKARGKAGRRKRPTKRKLTLKQRKIRQQRRRRIAKLALLLSFGGALIFAAYVYYLDTQVRTQFEGKRWALPAHVYARALELYPDQALSVEHFVTELKMLGYRPVSRPTLPGTYAQRGNAFVLTTRSFQFWDGAEKSQTVRLEFSRGQLLGIWKADTGDVVDLLRLDPPLIGNIYPSHREDRILVQLDDVPALLIDALLAVEDRDFFSHYGVSPPSILRALWVNLRAGRTVQGGSTLTQQLVKNFFLSNERTLWRKFNEAIMSLLLEYHYDKNEILEAYINEIYLGQDGRRSIHGFGLASQFYFGQTLKKLAPQQLTLLVALVKGPSYYDPRRHSLRAFERRNLVLQLLVQQGKLAPAVAQGIYDKVPSVLPQNSTRVSRVPGFIDLVRRQLQRDYSDTDLNSEGLRIFTTLDPGVQRATEQALSEQISRLQRRGATRDLQGAAVVVNVNDGEVQAVVGGRDPRFAGFNRALDAVRPVGSLIKPAVYLTALMQPERYTLASMLDDSPLDVDMGGGEHWQPQNFDHKSHGRRIDGTITEDADAGFGENAREEDQSKNHQVLLRDALMYSYNIPTARLGLDIGVPNVLETLRGLGAERPLSAYPSLLLGAANFSPLDVTQMYHTLAAGGFRTPLRAIRAVVTADGQPLQRYSLSVTRAFDSASIFLVNSALQAVTQQGTGRGLKSRLPEGMIVAGKTGTSDELRDSWFAGYSDNYVATVWLGLDDNRPAGLTGSSGALRVWGDILSRLDSRSLATEPPAGIDINWIDPRNGRLSDDDCPYAVQLPFISGTQPDEQSACERDVMDE